MARSDRTGALSLRDFDRALARISAEQRRVVLLIGLEDITYNEAATILDVPIGTIRSRLSRGRESLRKLMDWRDERRRRTVQLSQAPSNPKRFVPGFERTKNSRLLPM